MTEYILLLFSLLFLGGSLFMDWDCPSPIDSQWVHIGPHPVVDEMWLNPHE